MSATWDCHRCYGVYFSNFPGPHVCQVCGAELREREEGAEPFEGTDGVNDDDETEETQAAQRCPGLAGALAPVGG